MASFRIPLPTCESFGHPGVDEGTLCRSWSALPGTIRNLVSASRKIVATARAVEEALRRCAEVLDSIRGTITRARDTAGDAVDWGADAVKLYVALDAEGLLFLLDVYNGKPGSGALPIAEAFDKRVNKMGELHNEFSRKHRVGAMLPFDKLALWFAGDDVMKKKCLEHYIDEQGTAFRMKREQMLLMPTFFDVFDATYSPNMRLPIEEAKKGRTAKVKTSVAGQNDALGNFTIHLDGEVKPSGGSPTGPMSDAYYRSRKAADPGAELMFEGVMDWYDKWDFDSKLAKKFAGQKTGRPAHADMVVAAVAALVDGVPFDVITDAIPVTQYSGRFADY